MTVPLRVVVVPLAEPTVIVVVEPAAPLSPIEMDLVAPEAIAAPPIVYTPPVVAEFPRVIDKPVA